MLLLIGFWGGCDDNTNDDNNNNQNHDYECDLSIPVVLGGDTIPEFNITRNAYGCATRISLSQMEISDSNCLSGIETFGSTLLEFILEMNPFVNINLAPLSSCHRLELLDIAQCSITTIDVSPLSDCSRLEYLNLNGNNISQIDLSPLEELPNLYWFGIDQNPLDSLTCEQVCVFIDSHPYMQIYSPCECGKKWR